MNTFCIVLAIVAIRLANLDYGQANETQYIVTIYNKHTGSGKAYPLCAGILITNTCVLSTRFCIPNHAYKIRYGDMHTAAATYSKILTRKYHMNSHPELITDNRVNKNVVSGSNNIALALVHAVPVYRFARLLAADYKTVYGLEVQFYSFNLKKMMPELPQPQNQAVPKAEIREKDEIMMRNSPINLNHILMRKRKYIREYFMTHINLTAKRVVRPMPSIDRPHFIPRVQLLSSDKIKRSDDNTSVVQFSSGVVAPCPNKLNMGPYICVAIKCFENPQRTVIIPDFGTPITYDNKVLGLAADINENTLKFTPVSPYLNWIRHFVRYARPPVRSQQRMRSVFLNGKLAL